MSQESSSSAKKIAILKDRASMLAKARAFFMERGVLEVDCPIITFGASIDQHIDLIPALDVQGVARYLHSSPEYGMKRLLSEGMGDIYQISHVFRQGEYGRRHNPEFMMAEWYRSGFSLEQMMEETMDFISLFLGQKEREVLSYREALKKYAGLDYVSASDHDLIKVIEKHNLPAYDGIEKAGKDELLNLILGLLVEPHLGQNGLCALAYYPASQAALARKKMIGEEEAAERFEVYYQGIELANGYHELADAAEQRLRLQEANEARVQAGKDSLRMDERFLEALEKGIPDSCGVAVGFDRLMMLRHRAESLADVIPFAWDIA